ncbi:WD repeat, SAM and U-box domain-containing protein 1 [Austrofundulus limnaeus]|uniref:WD repeat, SAM and U-box domain-containing protein 1 n=1 Tax=Austrofundulus limnaeus TaxID=52670 RepID=A0A2I4BWK5_AUSLI|nr:PREDICTED: WD repeat, SAM and U-box domain-containing protein 1-like [Austrofundulus limnaeus]
MEKLCLSHRGQSVKEGSCRVTPGCCLLIGRSRTCRLGYMRMDSRNLSVFKANNIDGSESVGLRGRLLRKIEALKAEQSGSEASDDEFLRPIRELMKDPVIAADGYSYERVSIELDPRSLKTART